MVSFPPTIYAYGVIFGFGRFGRERNERRALPLVVSLWLSWRSTWRGPMLEFTNPLHAYRADRKLSIKELGEVINLSRAEMAAVEDGRRMITLEQRDMLAQRLKVDPEKLAYLVRSE